MAVLAPHGALGFFFLFVIQYAPRGRFAEKKVRPKRRFGPKSRKLKGWHFKKVKYWILKCTTIESLES